MQARSKLWRWLGLGLAAVVGLVVIARTWVVPRIIVSQLEARYQGRITIRNWWINANSAGVTGLKLHEGTAANSPVWASAERVATDLSLGGLLRGRLAPRVIKLRSPRIVFRIGRDGKPLTRPALKGGGSAGAVPAVVIDDGRITLRQEGRPEAIISGVVARLATEGGAEVLSARTNDPTWGPWTATGRFTDAFRQGDITLASPKVVANRAKVRRIPFVPAGVWDHVQPDGLVGVHLAIDWAPKQPVQTRTTVTYKRTTLGLPTLGLVAWGTTGRMTVERGVIRLDGVEGQSLDGTVKAVGTLDFAQTPPRIDLTLHLDGLDIADAPKRWQLDKAQLTGHLTGTVRLRVALTDAGADLTGSSGEAVIQGGSVGGIAVKSLRLVMHAEGSDLRYDTPSASASMLGGALLNLIALQAPAARKAESRTTVEPPPAGTPSKGLVLPRSISTEIELEDVDLVQVLSRVEAMGIHLPFPVAGRLSLKAKATIPLGKLRDIKAYAFHGEATLRAASIAGVDLGHVVARLDLADGVLDLRDFRGQLVALPEGGIHVQAPATEPVPAEGPLPPGGFRAALHAELSPPGRLTAHFEGDALPLGELVAPALPRPTPLDGLLTATAKAEADVAKLADPKAWTASGSLRSARITYRGSTLDAVSTSFDLADGRLSLPDLAAQLGQRPLKAHATLALAVPYEFSGELDVAGWDLSDVLAFVPTAPRPSPIDGALTAKADARGALSPWSIESQGEGQVASFRAGPVRLGDVPFRWATAKDVLTVSIPDARPFGGRLSAEAKIPARGSGPIEGSATIAGLDTAQLAASIPGDSLKLTGRADGTLQFAIPPHAATAATPLQANLQLSAPGLTVQGLPTQDLKATVQVRKGVLTYQLVAESLGGKVRLQGDIPLAGTPETEAKAEAQAVGFLLADAWPALGVTGALRKLRGLGAINANLLMKTEPMFSDLRARAIAEVRDLRWGESYPLGRLRGEIALRPTGWRVDHLAGELWGGPARGSFWGTTPTRGPRGYGFTLAVDRAALGRVVAFIPSLSDQLDGTATLRAEGRLDNALRASGEVGVSRGKLFGLPLSDLRAPVELTYTPASSAGSLVVRGWSTRLAGGRVHGDARFQLGLDRSFQGDLQLSAIDLETIVRSLSDVRRPASGKVNGRINLQGPNPDDLRRLRGRAVLDLDDASVVELPVFRELDRFLGASRGGLFEDGDVIASIAHGQVVLDPLTLEGRAVQLHLTGTVGFDTRLDLVVLVNTRELIPQTGQALVGVIPGLGDAVGRRDEAVRQVGNFLSDRLLKFRVTGTLGSPSVNIDPAVVVSTAAVGFFSGVLKLPLNLLR